MRASNPTHWKKASPQSTHTTACVWLRHLMSMESLPSMAGSSWHWEPRSSWLHRIAIRQSICTTPMYAFVTGGSKLYGPYQHVGQVVNEQSRKIRGKWVYLPGGGSVWPDAGLHAQGKARCGRSVAVYRSAAESINGRLSASRGCGGAGSRGARCRSHIRSP